MFNVVFDDKSYRIDFIHAQKNESPRWTKCLIKQGDTDEVVVESKALCSPKDNFNRAVGRKVALAKALQQKFERNERKQIWLMYFISTASESC